MIRTFLSNTVLAAHTYLLYQCSLSHTDWLYRFIFDENLNLELVFASNVLFIKGFDQIQIPYIVNDPHICILQIFSLYTTLSSVCYMNHRQIGAGVFCIMKVVPNKYNCNLPLALLL